MALTNAAFTLVGAGVARGIGLLIRNASRGAGLFGIGRGALAENLMAGAKLARLTKNDLDNLITDQARLVKIGNTNVLVFGYDEATLINLERLKLNPSLLDERRYYVLVHGSSSTPNFVVRVSGEGKPITAGQLANIMKSFSYDGGGCTLLSCYQGGPRGAAQGLSNILNDSVRAPRWAFRVVPDSSGFEVLRGYNGTLGKSLGIGNENTMLLEFLPLK